METIERPRECHHYASDFKEKIQDLTNLKLVKSWINVAANKKNLYFYRKII